MMICETELRKQYGEWGNRVLLQGRVEYLSLQRGKSFLRLCVDRENIGDGCTAADGEAAMHVTVWLDESLVQGECGFWGVGDMLSVEGGLVPACPVERGRLCTGVEVQAKKISLLSLFQEKSPVLGGSEPCRMYYPTSAKAIFFNIAPSGRGH